MKRPYQRATPPEEIEAQEKQCIYCSLYFQPDLLAQHQQAVHKEEMTAPEPQLPRGADSLPPGTIVNSGDGTGQPGIPLKVPWTRTWVEKGRQCPGSECGWRFISQVPAESAAPCPKCGRDGRPMFGMVEWEAPPDAAKTVIFNGVRYDISPVNTNIIPSIIRDIARQSIRDTRAATNSSNKLPTVGFLPPLEEEP